MVNLGWMFSATQTQTNTARLTLKRSQKMPTGRSSCRKVAGEESPVKGPLGFSASEIKLAGADRDAFHRVPIVVRKDLKRFAYGFGHAGVEAIA
jgi:hypothetical protein